MSDGNEFRGAMQRLEMSVERRLWAGMMEQAVDAMMTSEVGDDRTGRWHEQHHSGMMARDHAAHEVPWRPPWSRLVVVDAAIVELLLLLLLPLLLLLIILQYLDGQKWVIIMSVAQAVECYVAYFHANSYKYSNKLLSQISQYFVTYFSLITMQRIYHVKDSYSWQIQVECSSRQHSNTHAIRSPWVLTFE